MKRKILEYLICPACLPEENILRLRHAEISGEEVETGILECSRCRQAYPIKGGVASLVDPRTVQGGEALRYERPDLLSSYLWSHYADLFGDPEVTGAYSEWANQLLPCSGAGIDTGCAVGRFSFEMSRKCEFVIGIDRSERFISTARRIMIGRGLRFQIREEGRIHSERTFVLPPEWDSRKLEFIVGDANALPFRANSFSCVASLNLIDKLSRPIQHICDVNRTARLVDSQFLISDPFSWSEAVCDPEEWLGGVPDGKFPGAGIENIVRLLSGDGDLVVPPWKTTRQGEVWWKIRNHQNHFELIRSRFVKAER